MHEKFKFFTLLLLFMGQLLLAQNPVKVLAPEDNKIYFGAFPDFGGEENIVTEKRIEEFESLSRKKMAWVVFSQHWFQGMKYPKKEIHTIKDTGSIPYVRLLPRSTLKEFQKEENFSLIKIINGEFDNELKRWAEEAKNDNIPILIDFAVEMNGDWFGWSGNLNGADRRDGYGNSSYYDGPEKYRDAYRHIIDLFRDAGVHHVTWVFHPTIKSTPNETWNSPKYYYPGDDYIDWIGVSIYGPFHPKENYWDTFEEILSSNYRKIIEISTKKPLAILELGVTDHHPLGKKPKWIEDTFDTILSQKYLTFKAIIYWHENWDNDGILTSLRIDSSAKTLNTFREVIHNDRFISTSNLSKK